VCQGALLPQGLVGAEAAEVRQLQPATIFPDHVTSRVLIGGDDIVGYAAAAPAEPVVVEGQGRIDTRRATQAVSSVPGEGREAVGAEHGRDVAVAIVGRRVITEEELLVR